MTIDTKLMSVLNNKKDDYHHWQSSSLDPRRSKFIRHFMTSTVMHGTFKGDDSNLDSDSYTLTMDNIYTEWTIDDDRILYKNMNEP